MVAQPLFYQRGSVYVVKFPSDQYPGELINKYALSLQEGEILKNRRTFVGILLTTCKSNEPPRIRPWNVYVSPAESHTEFGVIVDCGQVYTFRMADVIDYAYTLEAGTMEKVDRALAYGVGFVRVEDLKKKRDEKE